MGKFATRQSFGGQRASVGRVVVVAQRQCDEQARDTGKIDVVSGSIVLIDEETDLPIIGTLTGDVYEPGAPDGDEPPDAEMRFVQTTTEADVDALPPGSWTWPARV